MASLNSLSKFIDANRLTGPNFNDWLLNLKLITNLKRITYVLDAPIPGPTAKLITQEEQDTLTKWQDDDLVVKSYILLSMSTELKWQHNNMSDSYSIITRLQDLYGEQSRNARFETCKSIFRAKMSLGESVGDHVPKMIS